MEDEFVPGYLWEDNVREPKTPKYILLKEKTTTTVNPGYFNRSFRENNIAALDKYNLSVYALGFLRRFECYIKNKNNCIMFDKNIPTTKQLCEKLNVGRTKMSEILNELESKGFIKRAHDGKRMIIYFNPYLASGWKEVDNDVVNMFANFKVFV